MGEIRGIGPIRRSTLCEKCGAPMVLLGFVVSPRRTTVFYYKCTKCEHAYTKTVR